VSLGFAVLTEVEGCIHDGWLLLDQLTPETDREFLLYCINHFTPRIRKFADGTTQPNLNTTIARSLVFPLPPIDQQKAISALLSCLDDKIDLNRRMNETLESMARAIFKSWFVDFDPVRAKAAGRKPAGMDADTAALFPNSLPIGEVSGPLGWDCKSIESLVRISRQTLTPTQHPGEYFDHYSIPAFDAGRMPVRDAGETILSNKFVVNGHSVLLSKLNPRIPRVWLPQVDSGCRSICSTEFIVLDPAGPNTREFAYCLLGSDPFCERYGGMTTGTSGSHQRVRPDDLYRLQMIVPPMPVIERFTGIARPLLGRVCANRQESVTLTGIRDTLLPKLLSGEIRIRDAEKLVESHL
jgi:type I restriction enzyme S subunit